LALIHQLASPFADSDSVGSALIGDAGLVERGQADYGGKPASTASRRIASSS
jgi:hypothetical protein